MWMSHPVATGHRSPSPSADTLYCLAEFVVVFTCIVHYLKKCDNYICRKRLQEQCKLVLEENELLMEQLDVQQQKYNEQHKTHAQEGRSQVYDSFGDLFLLHAVASSCFVVADAGYQTTRMCPVY